MTIFDAAHIDMLRRGVGWFIHNSKDEIVFELTVDEKLYDVVITAKERKAE